MSIVRTKLMLKQIFLYVLMVIHQRVFDWNQCSIAINKKKIKKIKTKKNKDKKKSRFRKTNRIKFFKLLLNS